MQRDIETKFQFPPQAAPGLLSWLTAHCHADGAHPANRVHSIYFDTPELASLREKLNSDYLKSKLRLRWYGPPEGPAGAERRPVFAEVKSKTGSNRSKYRLEVPLAAEALEHQTLDSGPAAGLARMPELQELGVSGHLVPVLALSYLRQRFLCPESGARINLDSNIRVERTHPGMIGGASGMTVPHVVLEVKGASDDLPTALHPLMSLGGRRSSFSKYLTCYQSATAITTF